VFRKEGPQRPHHHNQILAGYLAMVAGFVNSAGFIAIGSFTSHVTGNAGRFANDVALHRFAAAGLAFTMVVAFYLGAFVASVLLESNVLRRPYAYGSLLLVEAFGLLAFVFAANLITSATANVNDIKALILCAAMGLQNSLVTRLSGAVVRTTHLTGIVTDLGIESARWFRFWRARLGEKANVRLVVGANAAAEPAKEKLTLLLTMFCAFVVGGAVGAVLSVRFPQWALMVPIGFLTIGAIVALRSGFDLARDSARK
jgi:uncharacterized membrane protein YoaK (UPF0700 family)